MASADDDAGLRMRRVTAYRRAYGHHRPPDQIEGSIVVQDVAHVAGSMVERGRQVATASSRLILRGLLLVGILLSVLGALWISHPASYLQADPDLARLIRGMAVIKAVLVLPALGVLYWRFGHPISPAVAAWYLIGTWLIVATTTLIWQLTLIPIAAIAFHAVGLALLIAAWWDRGAVVVIASVRRGARPAR